MLATEPQPRTRIEGLPELRACDVAPVGSAGSTRLTTSFRDELMATLPSLRRYAAALTRTRHDADDLIQDTVERALLNEHLYVESGSMGSWIRSIAYHAFIDKIRRRQRYARIEGTMFAEMSASGAGVAPPRQVDQRFACEVRRLIDEVLSADREVMLIVGFQGSSYCDAADRLGLSINTVRSRLWRARATLSAAVRDDSAPLGGDEQP